MGWMNTSSELSKNIVDHNNLKNIIADV